MKTRMRQKRRRFRPGVPVVVVVAGAMLAAPGVASGQCATAFAPVIRYATSQIHSNTLAVADFNGDGRPDLLTTASPFDSQVAIHLGNGDGTLQLALNSSFAPATAAATAVGDFDENGQQDVVCVGFSGAVIRRGNGNGSFQPAHELPIGGTGVTVADFNGDDHRDLAIIVGAPTGIGILLGQGDGAFAAPIAVPFSTQPSSLTAADFNGDGNMDLAVARPGSITVLLGRGDGTFNAPADELLWGSSATFISSADLNGDHRLDLVARVDGSVSIMIGKGDGTFQPRTVVQGLSGQPIAIVDVNGDGALDLAAPSGFGIGILRGLGDGTFQQPPTTYAISVGNAIWTIAAGRFRGDGSGPLDLVVGGEGGVYLCLNANSIGITQQPAKVSTIAGQAATFSVMATSSTPISYRWRRDGVELADGGTVSGAASPVLTISPTTLADNGATFDCVLTGLCASLRSNSAGLAVTTACRADMDGVNGATIDDLFLFFNTNRVRIPGAFGACAVARGVEAWHDVGLRQGGRP